MRNIVCKSNVYLVDVMMKRETSKGEHWIGLDTNGIRDRSAERSWMKMGKDNNDIV